VTECYKAAKRLSQEKINASLSGIRDSTPCQRETW